jgi:hypothetical protein
VDGCWVRIGAGGATFWLGEVWIDEDEDVRLVCADVEADLEASIVVIGSCPRRARISACL